MFRIVANDKITELADNTQTLETYSKLSRTDRILQDTIHRRKKGNSLYLRYLDICTQIKEKDNHQYFASPVMQ